MTAEHGQSNVPTTTAIPKISSSESASLKKSQDTYPKKQATTLVVHMLLCFWAKGIPDSLFQQYNKTILLEPHHTHLTVARQMSKPCQKHL